MVETLTSSGPGLWFESSAYHSDLQKVPWHFFPGASQLGPESYNIPGISLCERDAHPAGQSRVESPWGKACYYCNKALMKRPPSGATISDDEDGIYRYDLRRTWGSLHRPGEIICFIGLNPSVANAYKNDPTITREIGFAQREGFAGLIKVNLYAAVSTDPKKLFKIPNAIGHENDEYIQSAVKRSAMIVPCWGNGVLPDIDRYSEARCAAVTRLIGEYELRVLGVTKHGEPAHPLRLPKNRAFTEWHGCKHSKQRMR